MEITIIAIGKMKASPELTLFDNYIKNCRWKVLLKEFECKNDLPSKERCLKESEMLLEAVPKGAVIVAMDEKGKELSSLEFAGKMQKWLEDKGKVAFLIGGAEGHHDILRKKADYILSMGKMTWPHFMARTMLAEQIYRTKTILDGHPYHKE